MNSTMTSSLDSLPTSPSKLIQSKSFPARLILPAQIHHISNEKDRFDAHPDRDKPFMEIDVLDSISNNSGINNTVQHKIYW